MKKLSLLFAVCCVSGVSTADRLPDIIFTNKVASFTNLQGKAFVGVELVRANNDGVVWRDKEGGMGLVSYTNVSPALLTSWGIPEDRAELMRTREEQKRAAAKAAVQAAADARRTRAEDYLLTCAMET